MKLTRKKMDDGHECTIGHNQKRIRAASGSKSESTALAGEMFDETDYASNVSDAELDSSAYSEIEIDNDGILVFDCYTA